MRTIIPILIRIGLVIPIGIHHHFGIQAVFGLTPGYISASEGMGFGVCQGLVSLNGFLTVVTTIGIQIYTGSLVIITAAILPKIG